MSLAVDLNTGGIVDAMAARFARADAARAEELERLIRAGKGDKEPPRRKLQVVEREETPMPRKAKQQPKGPCPECGSPTCHKQTCSRRPGGPVKPAEKAEKAQPSAPRRAAPKRVSVFDPSDASVEGLVAVIRACQDELEHRQEQLRAQLDAVAKAIGSAA